MNTAATSTGSRGILGSPKERSIAARIFGAFDSPAALILPALIFLLFFFGYPLVRMTYLSFDGPHLSLRNYVSFFQDGYFWVLWRTIQISIVTTIATLLIGYPIAYAMASAGSRRRSLLLLAVLLPYLTSFLVRSYAWITILDDRGLVNTLLMRLGVIDAPLVLLYNYISVYIAMIQVLLPYMILPLFATMTTIDKSGMLAAQSLGAGTLRTFFRIYLPQTTPGIRSGCLLVFLLALGFYVTPAMLGGLGDVTLSMLITTQVMQLADWNAASAAAVILLATTALTVGLLGKPIRASSRKRALVKASSGPEIDVSPSSDAPMSRGYGQTVSGDLPGAPALRQFLVNPPLLNGRNGKILLSLAVILGILFLLLPTLIVVPISFSAASYLQFPPQAWSLRWYENFFGQPEWTSAALLSIRVAAGATTLAVILGTGAALALQRGNLPFKTLLWAFIVAPLVVPTVVIGVSLYHPLAQWGLIGHSAALVIGHSIGGIPYVVIIVASVLASLDDRYERAAQSLGAGPVRVFFRVTLPLIAPGVLGGAIFAFIHSFDELVIALFVSGVNSQTLPLKMWEDIRNQIDPTIAAVSSLLMLVPAVALLILNIARVGPGTGRSA